MTNHNQSSRYACTALSLVAALGMSLAYIQYVRLPMPLYALTSLWCGFQVLRMARLRSFVLCAFGSAMWAVFTIGWLVVNAEFLNFSGMLTRLAFTDFNNTSALNALGASLCLFCAVADATAPAFAWHWTRPSPVERSFARTTALRCIVAGAALAALTSAGDFIFHASYSGDLTGEAVVQSGGMAMASLMLLSFAAVAAARGYGMRNLHFAGIAGVIVVVVLTTRFLKGDRGGTLVVSATLFVVWYMSSRLRPIGRAAAAVCAVVGLLTVFQLWGEIRYYVSDYGFVNSVAESASRGSSRHWTDVDLLRIQLIPAAYWHMLNVVSLSHDGVELGARRIVDLAAMAIPQNVAAWFGYTRPQTGAWLLAAYRVNSGGLFVLAEAFWSLGIVGALGAAAGIAFMGSHIERFVRRNDPIVGMAYIPLVGSVGFAMFYGLQPFARALEMSLAAAWCLSRLYRRGSKSAAPANRERASIELPEKTS